jgi:hypothetical protein
LIVVVDVAYGVENTPG